MNDLGYLTSFAVLFCTYILYSIVIGVWRLFYHPLSEFPGPRLAVFSTWYMCYYDLFMHGALVEQLEKLHILYGPVVRISPNELHFSDPDAYAGIYFSGSKFAKDPFHYRGFIGSESSFTYTDPRASKIRRDALLPLFSRRAILKLESTIQENVDKLVRRVLSHTQAGKPVNLTMAFRATALDTVTSYCFARCQNTLDADDFHHPILLATDGAVDLLWTFKYFPVLKTILLSLPDWLANRLNPDAAAVSEVTTEMSAQIDEFLADPGLLERADQEVVYHHLLNPQAGKDRNYRIPSKESLLDEAVNFLFAGGDTTGNACTVGTFNILNNPTVHLRLFKELVSVWDDKDRAMDYESLEKLPYLTACIKESLRMSHGTVSPLPRIVGPTNAEIAGYHIPAGATVSMGSTFMHNNPDIFPHPLQFDPERWLQPNAKELDFYLVPFSRGPRSCIAVNLAWCELYLILGNLFRKVEMELYDTSSEDLRWRAFFLPLFCGKHLRVLVKERSS